MARVQAMLAVLVVNLLAYAMASSRPVMQFDFYRAMTGEAVGAYPIQNFNLASIAGVSKYVHTEVIAEHTIAEPDRLTRKNGIDTIARLRVKVRNPAPVLVTDGRLATQVDFGPFVTYDSGVATNPHTQTLIQQYGSFVGVQQQTDVRWPYTVPYYWFSLTGWCPNMRYDEIPMTHEKYMQEQAARSGLCHGLAGRDTCAAHPEECILAGESCIARDPAPQCLNYTSNSDHSGHVLGGLCPGGVDNLAVEPTGELGCTYTYAHAAKVSIDEVVGILGEDCGGRLCRDWLDFRQHCSNPAYRKKFDAATGKPMSFKYCVEYDVHPACEKDCTAAACQSLPMQERELGLPFWQGKCSDKANEMRTGLFQQASLKSREDTVKPDPAYAAVNFEETCIYANPGMCTPAPGQGGNYCTRQWAGVCSNCFIPGTRATWLSRGMPYCPYKLLSTKDYQGAFPKPKCRTSDPKDLCCLYTGECSLRATTAAQAPPDESGFALVASWENTTAMAAFLQRAAVHHSMHVVPEALDRFAQASWSINPRKHASLRATLSEMLSVGAALTETSTTSTATSTTVTTSTSTATTTPSQALGGSLALWLLGGIGLLACAGLLGGGLFLAGRSRGWFGQQATSKLGPRMPGRPRGAAAGDLEAPAKTLQVMPQVQLRAVHDLEAAEALEANLPRLLGRRTGGSGDAHEYGLQKIGQSPFQSPPLPAAHAAPSTRPCGEQSAWEQMHRSGQAKPRFGSDAVVPFGLGSDLQDVHGITVRVVNDRHLDEMEDASNSSGSMAGESNQEITCDFGDQQRISPGSGSTVQLPSEEQESSEASSSSLPSGASSPQQQSAQHQHRTGPVAALSAAAASAGESGQRLHLQHGTQVSTSSTSPVLVRMLLPAGDEAACGVQKGTRCHGGKLPAPRGEEPPSSTSTSREATDTASSHSSSIQGEPFVHQSFSNTDSV